MPSIPRLAAAGISALAITLAACGSPDAGVEAGRSDRTRGETDATPATTDAEPVATGPTESVTTDAPPATDPPATDPPTTDPPATDPPADTTPPDTIAQPPAPAAEGLGSVSADDLESVFLPANPDLLGAANNATSGREPREFLDDAMTFSGMDPVIEIAGAPITRWSHTVFSSRFDDNGTASSASRLSSMYRMAVEVENDDIDGFAEQLRDELRPIVEAANPGEEVVDTLTAAPLGNGVFGLRVGPEDDPTTQIEIDQHYVVVPRLVDDLLLAVTVTRSVEGDDLAAAELPGRSLFVDAALDEQIDLFAQVDTTAPTPVLGSLRVLVNIPSAGSATISHAVDYIVLVPADDFETYVDAVGDVVEANDYSAVENFGDRRTFDHVEERLENEFIIENIDSGVVVSVRGDITAYSG